MLISRFIRYDRDKNSKLSFYLKNIGWMLLPSFLFHFKADKVHDKEIEDRVNYYNKLQESFDLDPKSKTIAEFIKQEKKSTYFFDLLYYLKYFNSKLRIFYLFGDITYVPKSPAIVKSRPIKGDNKNSVLMKLNSVRHFIFVDDELKFEEKKDMLVWRGKAYQPHRVEFLKRFYDHRLCDVGQTNTKGDLTVPWQKEKLSLRKQLEYKFILAIEGNDVASNLKWAMSSNSLVFMTKPKYETWFMEGSLRENYHYVLLKDDYSDLEEKILYYTKNIDKAKEIISNAHKHVAQFQDQKREKLIALLVLKKYFQLSKQKV